MGTAVREHTSKRGAGGGGVAEAEQADMGRESGRVGDRKGAGGKQPRS